MREKHFGVECGEYKNSELSEKELYAWVETLYMHLKVLNTAMLSEEWK